MKSVEYSLCIEYTHLLTKVKQRQAWLVLGWVTTCEYHNPHVQMTIYLWHQNCYGQRVFGF